MVCIAQNTSHRYNPTGYLGHFEYLCANTKTITVMGMRFNMGCKPYLKPYGDRSNTFK